MTKAQRKRRSAIIRRLTEISYAGWPSVDREEYTRLEAELRELER